MSETFHTEESLSNQIYLAELPLSAMSALTSAVCKVVGPKGRMSLWREWCCRGLEDEAIPWLFWGLALVNQQRTTATIKANLLMRMNDLDWWSEWIEFINIMAPGIWHLEMGFSGHFLALLFSVLKGNRYFDESRKDLLTSFENKVLSASWRTRVLTGVCFYHLEYVISLHLIFECF